MHFFDHDIGRSLLLLRAVEPTFGFNTSADACSVG